MSRTGFATSLMPWQDHYPFPKTPEGHLGVLLRLVEALTSPDFGFFGGDSSKSAGGAIDGLSIPPTSGQSSQTRWLAALHRPAPVLYFPKMAIHHGHRGSSVASPLVDSGGDLALHIRGGACGRD